MLNKNHTNNVYQWICYHWQSFPLFGEKLKNQYRTLKENLFKNVFKAALQSCSEK